MNFSLRPCFSLANGQQVYYSSHFKRILYRQDRPEDVMAFTGCLRKFQSILPHEWGNELIHYAEALHENTLGCVGTLSAVLTRTAKLSIAQGGWSVSALERALLTDAQRTKILDEILEGEAAINPSLTRHLPRITHSSRGKVRGAA